MFPNDFTSGDGQAAHKVTLNPECCMLHSNESNLPLTPCCYVVKVQVPCQCHTKGTNCLLDCSLLPPHHKVVRLYELLSLGCRYAFCNLFDITSAASAGIWPLLWQQLCCCSRWQPHSRAVTVQGWLDGGGAGSQLVSSGDACAVCMISITGRADMLAESCCS